MQMPPSLMIKVFFGALFFVTAYVVIVGSAIGAVAHGVSKLFGWS